jgi:mono/diheme cytochrome c family protein
MLQRLLIEKMEHRIIVGILSFLGIMVLVGWIAINEGGRMQAFERQYLARSIERGAALFNSNCASCHANDGLGLAGRGPALNSPYLFGHDFLASVDRETDTLTRTYLADGLTTERVTAINTRLDEIATELANAATTAERATELQTEQTALRAELIDPNLSAEQISEIETRLAALETERAAIIQELQPAINNGYDPEVPSRLARLGWGGTLNSYIYTTLVHGRPLSSLYWPSGQGMGAWSQTAGGPLRGDQLEDLTNYILNWDKGEDWTTDHANAVVQYPINPVDGATVVMDSTPRVGTDVAAIEAELVNFTGDPVNGQALYNGGTYACAGCHMNAAVAPLTDQTWAAAQTVRLEAPENAGLTPDQYLITSIVAPNSYVVPGYNAGAMPQNFGERMTHQDLADILAYIKSYDSGAQASADAG